MRLLLTGASGFIGSHLVKRLRSDHEVYAMSRCSLGDWFHGEVCRWEATERLDLATLPTEIDVVCYGATSRRHRDGWAAHDDLMAVNVDGVVPLLDWARQANVRQFIYLSTGSVYGAGSAEEDARPVPRDFYGASKLAGETLVAGYSRFFDVFIPRLYTPYGPDQADRLVPTLIDRVSSGRAVELHGTDGFVVQPTFIDDVIAVLTTAIEQRWEGIVNVAGPRAVPLRALAIEIGAVVGREPMFVPAGDEGEPPVDQKPDRSRLQQRLGETFPWVDLAEGLNATWQSRRGL